MTDDDAQLPAVLAEIARIAGIDAAWELAAAKGGQEVFIPRRCGAGHWLTELLGQETANKLCDYFRGNHVDRVLIPMGTPAQKARRLAQAMQEGLSVDKTAGRAGVHKRTIYRHRARTRQPSLFDD